MSDAPDRTGVPPGALAFLLATVLVNTIGFGLLIPVTPALIASLTGDGIEQAAAWGGSLMFVYAAMQFLFAPIMGNLSDRFGRRPVLLIAIAALSVDYLLMALAPTIAWLFAGRLLAGMLGATAPVANAYMADISSGADRARNFGLIGAAWGVGFVLGPVIGGLLGELGPRVPFWTAAALTAGSCLFGLLVLPETLQREHRRPFALRRANPIGTALQLRGHALILPMLGVAFLYQLAHDANPSVWSYATMVRFDWTELQVGLSLGLVGVMSIIVQGFLIRPVIKRLGEPRAVVTGLALMSFGFAGFAFAREGWQMLVMVLPFCLGTFAMPALRSLASNRIADSEQGALQGAFSSTASLSAIIAPLVMTSLFTWFTSGGAPFAFPGAPFFLAAVLALASLLSFRRLGLQRSPPAATEADRRDPARGVMAERDASEPRSSARADPDLS